MFALHIQFMILSILIPSIPSRLESHLIPLIRELERQIDICTTVEILTLCDNKKRSIGAKRQALLNLAQGEYVCFWRREVVQHCTFPDSNYGEDWAWAEQANKKVKYAHRFACIRSGGLELQNFQYCTTLDLKNEC